MLRLLLAFQLLCACFVSGCPKFIAEDCTGFSQVDALQIELLEPYKEGGAYTYDRSYILATALNITASCPEGMLDTLSAPSGVQVTTIGKPDRRPMACNRYPAAFGLTTAGTTIDDPDHNHASALMGDTFRSRLFERRELDLGQGCHGRWIALLTPTVSTSVVPAPPLDELLFAPAVPGQVPPLLFMRVFDFSPVDACFESLGIDENEYPAPSCFDVWAAQAHPVQ